MIALWYERDPAAHNLNGRVSGYRTHTEGRGAQHTLVHFFLHMERGAASRVLKTVTYRPTCHLDTLDVSHGNLEHLDLSLFVHLTVLVCKDNRLTSLDVSKLTRLRQLSCQSNRLREIRGLDRLTTVKMLEVQYNRLREIPSLAKLRGTLSSVCLAYNRMPTYWSSYLQTVDSLIELVERHQRIWAMRRAAVALIHVGKKRREFRDVFTGIVARMIACQPERWSEEEK